MKVIIFNSNQTQLGLDLQKRIFLTVPTLKVQPVDSMDMLAQKLCRPLNQIGVIILLAVDKEQIHQLNAYNDILNGTHLIFVIAPDKRSSLLPIALQFKTAFIGHPEALDDVVSVLKKIVIRIRLQNKFFADRKL